MTVRRYTALRSDQFEYLKFKRDRHGKGFREKYYVNSIQFALQKSNVFSNSCIAADWLIVTLKMKMKSKLRMNFQDEDHEDKSEDEDENEDQNELSR